MGNEWQRLLGQTPRPQVQNFAHASPRCRCRYRARKKRDESTSNPADRSPELYPCLLLGCSPPSSPTPEDALSAQTDAAVDRVLRLMRQRLVIMHDIARWKWNGQRPIADPERERAFLDASATKARSSGLDPEFARAFFAAQIEAAKQLQDDDFRQWQAEGREKFADVPDLSTQIRPRIDAVSSELLGALAALQPDLGKLMLRDRIRRQAADVLAGDGITESIRAIAIRPLMAP